MLANASHRHQPAPPANREGQPHGSVRRCVFGSKCRTIGASAALTVSSLSSMLFVSRYSSSVLLLLLLSSLTFCCLGASPVQLQTVLVSGCMLWESMLLSFVVAVCVVVCSVVGLLLLLLSEFRNSLLNCRSAISCRCCTC